MLVNSFNGFWNVNKLLFFAKNYIKTSLKIDNFSVKLTIYTMRFKI